MILYVYRRHEAQKIKQGRFFMRSTGKFGKREEILHFKFVTFYIL